MISVVTEERTKNPRLQTVAEWIRDYEGVAQVDMSKYGHSDSKDLKAADFVGKNLKVVIEAVEIRHYPATDDKPANDKPVLTFLGKEKGLVLNATNTKTLITAYGPDSDSWVTHEIGLTVADYTDRGFGHGWVVTALDVEPEDFDDDIPF